MATGTVKWLNSTKGYADGQKVAYQLESGRDGRHSAFEPRDDVFDFGLEDTAAGAATSRAAQARIETQKVGEFNTLTFLAPDAASADGKLANDNIDFVPILPSDVAETVVLRHDRTIDGVALSIAEPEEAFMSSSLGCRFCGDDIL